MATKTNVRTAEKKRKRAGSGDVKRPPPRARRKPAKPVAAKPVAAKKAAKKATKPVAAKKATKPVAAKKATKPVAAKKAAKPVAAKKATKPVAAKKATKPVAAKKAKPAKKRKPKPLSRAHRAAIAKGLRRYHREEARLAKERSERAKAGAATRRRRTRALEQASRATPEQRVAALARLAREQGALPRQRERARPIDTIFRKGRRQTLVFHQLLTERLLTVAVHRVGRAMANAARTSALFLATVVLVLYGSHELRGGSPQALSATWWAPDAAEASVVYASTGTQTSLPAMLLVLEERLADALSGKEGTAVWLESIHLSDWSERTTRERAQWHKQKRKVAAGMVNIGTRRTRRSAAGGGSRRPPTSSRGRAAASRSTSKTTGTSGSPKATSSRSSKPTTRGRS